jgi:ABC-2 type transport system permease protein
MIADIWTVLWKEWRELLLLYGSKRGTISRLLFSGLLIAVVLPLQTGKLWVKSPLVIGLSGWLALTWVVVIVADSFAGERERHTLETLLASPLSDRAILLGKVAAVVSYGWAYTMLILLMALVTVNVSYRGEGLLYPVPIALGAVTFALESALLAASAGVLVSLKATTVRQAQQQLGLAILALTLIPSLGLSILPDTLNDKWFLTLEQTQTTQVFLMILLVVLVFDFGLLLVAMARFKRSRLIVD